MRIMGIESFLGPKPGTSSLKSYESGDELSKGLKGWFSFYNEKRTPDEAYFQGLENLRTAA